VAPPRALAAAVVSLAVAGPLAAQQSGAVDDLIARMTVEQKLRLVNGSAALGNAAAPNRVPGAAGATVAFPDLGIPSLVLADGPAGLRIAPTREGQAGTFYATAFPIATALSSTWDQALLEEVGAAMGGEVRDYGVDFLLGPAMNIHRNPLTGRNFEYFSEDPYLSGRSAAAIIRGVQSRDVGATLKHFVANNQETNRFLVDTQVGERALREIYLRGFEIAVRESSPRAVMSSYNKVNGVYTSQSYDLLTSILRGDWGYRGFVMTDWFSGNDAVAQIQAGNDLLMPGTPAQAEQLSAAVAAGTLDLEALDRSVRRILEAVVASPAYRKITHSNRPDLAGHARVARRAAAEGTVLLKNEGGVLPLQVGLRVAAFGITSYDLLSSGTGSGDVNEAYTVSLVDGMRAQEFTIDRDLERVYTAYLETARAALPERRSLLEPVLRPEEMAPDPALLASKAREADIALITVGRIEGEAADRLVDGGFLLTERELALIHDVAAAFHAAARPVVAVLNVGGVVEVASWRDEVDAILLPWQGGQEAGNAIADVISGRVAPSGKLPMTFPVRYEDVPSAPWFPGANTGEPDEPVAWGRRNAPPSAVRYEEGVYVGYRHYATRNVPVAYPFGWGLSYTRFRYDRLSLSSARFDEELTVSIDVTNEGDTPGREAVQLYLSAPPGSLDKPALELKGFAKTRTLAPGETETLVIPLGFRDLASFDANRSAWVAEPGTYVVRVGASSADIRAEAPFTLDELLLATTSRALMLER
jgi:beta-glucosidase